MRSDARSIAEALVSDPAWFPGSDDGKRKEFALRLIENWNAIGYPLSKLLPAFGNAVFRFPDDAGGSFYAEVRDEHEATAPL